MKTKSSVDVRFAPTLFASRGVDGEVAWPAVIVLERFKHPCYVFRLVLLLCVRKRVGVCERVEPVNIYAVFCNQKKKGVPGRARSKKEDNN